MVDREQGMRGLPRAKAAALFQKMAPRLDGTKVAELLGLYYFACAQRPQPIRESPEGEATSKPAARPARVAEKNRLGRRTTMGEGY